MIDVLPVRTPTVPPATHTNCYRFGRVVIDPASPYPDEQERLASWAEGVDTILLTHHHLDHVGGVADLVARTGAKVYAHTDARVAFPVDVRLEDGDVIDTGATTGAARLRCLHTPGHADGHLCFLDEQTGDIVAGDMVAGFGTIVLIEPEGHLATYLGSLSRLLPLAGRLLPAHGPVLESGPAVLRQYIAHRHARTEQIAAALAGGPRDPMGIAAIVYAGVPGVHLGLAAVQVRTHLTWLIERGRVVARPGGTFTLVE
ncbi:MAG: MBL fold metallo-hydrolase [Pseudomonadota bacterium]|nr:MBL fold metallo-hydrolase [Pseudomonadota bacterium]